MRTGYRVVIAKKASTFVTKHILLASHVSAASTEGAQRNALTRKLVAIAAGTKIPFRVVLVDGTTIENDGGSPAFTVTFRTLRAERRTIGFGYVGLLESYIAGDVNIDGEIALAFRAGIDSGYDRKS